jgi:amino acid adenylation domain-containing protein
MGHEHDLPGEEFESRKRCCSAKRDTALTISVLAKFEERARECPEALAVSFAGRRVTYARLNEQANWIAASLKAAGVRQGALVAVYLERSPRLIAGLLGVWKAGGAYLPIDPTNPRQRVALTLEDSEVAFVLTEKKLTGLLPATGATLLCVDDLHSAEPADIAASEAAMLPAEPLPEHLAYVIYTSGSTGRPKGAEITHGALSNLIESIGNDVSLQPSDVVLASATVAFDIANEEIFLPLMAGASVHLLEQEFVGDGGKLVEVMRRSQPSLVFGTPTSWRLVLEAGWQGDPKLQVIVGGEVLPLSLARTLAGMTRAVWNHYGPTETAICATRERIYADTEQVTLGWPIDGVSVYVLDKELRPLTAGKAGEIYIGGAGVGRGYRNRPELTELAFLADPFSSNPGARMYKTGDLGRLLPDGRLDFQGRVDNQVKLRGFRIELEEIEATIRSFEGVHAAVAEVVEYGAEDQRLVGYFFAEKQIVAAELREALRQRLPYYMMPTVLIPLESLPMTSNGKVDREGLRTIRVAFEKGAPQQSTPPPSDDLEAKLLAIWKKLLKVRHLGLHDDFFDKGGHSLLAARMFAEIQRFNGRKIPLSVLIKNPTVAQLGDYLRNQPETDWLGLVPIRERGSSPPLFVSHGLGSHLLLFRGLTDELGSDQPVYGIQLAAPLTAKVGELSLEAIAARNVEEICALDPVGPYYLAGHSLGGLLVFEIAAQLLRRGKEVGLLALLDCALQETQRSNNETAEAFSLRNFSLRWRKKFSRLFERGFVITTWRKLLYNQLMFKIWLLRHTYREGGFHPQLFGMDAYIALFAERYEPQPIEVDGVLFVAEDEVASESVGRGWSRLLHGRLTVQKVPGSHQTIFDAPNVSVLAKDLARRVERSSHPPEDRAASKLKNETRQPMMRAVLGYHQG